MNSTMTTNRKLKITIGVILAMLLVAIIIMSVFLGLYTSDRTKLRTNIENIYQQSYYTLIEDIVRIEQSLNKLQVVSSANLMRNIMEEITRNSTSATSALITMNTGNEELRRLMSFFNQVGDYNLHLMRQINSASASGDKNLLKTEDYKNLGEMATICRDIGRKLSSLQDHISDGYMFIDLLGSESDFFGEIIAELNGSGMSYPSLIYDGPFSDGVADRPAKGISGEEIDSNAALELVSKYLPGYKINKSTMSGESSNRIPSYNISSEVNAERTVNMQISKQGGSLLMMDVDKEISDPTIDMAEAEARAEQYCKDIGLVNMKAVWATNNHSTVYINLCYTEDNTIYYPDMVKVKVALDTGEIIGYEGLNYAFNHTVRKLAKPAIGEADAILGISSKLTDLSCRLALIPLTVNTELLCYEVSGKVGEDIYFIYVDAMSGEEVKIMRVIDSNQGELLM